MRTTQHWASAAIEIPQASPQRLTSAHESWVDVVRLLAAFLIVCIHSLKLDSRFGELPLGSPEWIAVDMLLAATRWALPIFVMISGYFLLDPRKSLDLHSYYHRRVQRLAWPLLAWTMLYLGISAYDAMLAGRPTSLAAMAIGVIKGAPYYHLWYLYMVPGLYLVAPFVKAATDHMSPGELIAAVATCFAFTILSAAIDGMSGLPSGSYITQFPRYLGYFLAGHLLGRVLPTPKLTAAVVMMVMAALAAATMAWIVAHQLSPARALRVFGFGNPAIIILSLAAFVLVRRLPIRAPWCSSLGPLADASLGIYLVHPAIIGVLQRWAQSNATPVLAIQATAVFVASLLIVLRHAANAAVASLCLTDGARPMTHLSRPPIDQRSAFFPRARLAPASVKVTPLPDGGMRLTSPLPLQSYPPRLSDMLCRWASRTPDQVFIAERVEVDGCKAWRGVTYAQMFAAVRAVGQALLNRGLSVDRPLAILSGNSIDHAIMALAAMHVGVPVVPISPVYSLASKTFSKLLHILHQVQPGQIFVADWDRFAPALRAAALRAEVVVGGNKPDGVSATTLAELSDATPGGAVEVAAARVGPDTVAKILFSSGSTGSPKGVITTQRMMCSNQTAVSQVWPFLLERRPVLVDWLPWHHVFGGSFCVNLALFHGGTIYIDDGAPSPRLIGRTIANLREISPTLYLNVPLGYDMLLPHLERDAKLRERFFSELDFLFYAAASLPVPQLRRLERLGVQVRGEPVPMISAWGATETAPVATAVHFDLERTSMIGLPVPGCEIKLVPSGGNMELRVRGPNVTPGYWRRDDLTEAAFDDDGFLRIGDAGRLADSADPRRGLEFTGRLAEEFKLSSGTWVSPGALRIRAIAAGAPVIQDAVITGHDRAEVGLLIVPSEQGCRDLCPEAPATASLATLLAAPSVRQCIERALAAMTARSECSSMHPTRALLMREPLSADDNEITDKGYINQRAVLARRYELVDRLYAVPSDPEVVFARDGKSRNATAGQANDIGDCAASPHGGQDERNRCISG